MTGITLLLTWDTCRESRGPTILLENGPLQIAKDLLRLLLFREGLLRSVRLLGLCLLGDLLVHLLRVLDLDLGLRDRRLGLRDLDLYLLQRFVLDVRLRAERGPLLGLALLFLSTWGRLCSGIAWTGFLEWVTGGVVLWHATDLGCKEDDQL